jgi:plastocyanin
MYRLLTAAGLAALALAVVACGDYNGPSPTTPDGTAAPPADAIVIDIVGENGARSFSPNPATIPAGRTVVWHNVDRTTHRVLLDDRRLDAGNIAPGAFSAAMTLPAAGAYHCTIHPDMVGTLNDR